MNTSASRERSRLHPNDFGSVDTSRVDKTIVRRAIEPDTTDMTSKYIINGGLPMAAHILVRFLRQIEAQGDWIDGATYTYSSTCAYGYLAHPSGSLALIVYQNATNANVFHVGFVRTFLNRTARQGGGRSNEYLFPDKQGGYQHRDQVPRGKFFDPSK